MLNSHLTLQVHLSTRHLNIPTFTHHSREPNRQLQIHQQLVQARRLRASLDDVANRIESLPSTSSTSYPQAMEILQLSHPQIHQLARLTEALRGGYTLNSNE